MPDLIVTAGLTKHFGNFKALDDCSLQVGCGEVFGLLGPNGAGKSTLIRLLLGFLRPTLGSAQIAGLDCYRDQVRVHAGLSYLPGDARLFRTMTGRQVLKFFGQVRGHSIFQRALEISQRLDLNLNRRVGWMSTGMRQKLALVSALAVEQPLLILDEPTANLDPSVRKEVLRMVAEARSSGRTVLFSSHILSEIEESCDRVAILRAGKVVHQQCLNELKRNYQIVLEQPIPPAALAAESGLQPASLPPDGIHFLTVKGLPAALETLRRWGGIVRHIQPDGLRTVYERFHPSPEDVLA